MVNKVILIGNLGKDPEVRRLENGAVVAKFSLATNESYKDKGGEWQTQTEWHDIIVWRTLAERAEQQLKKGSQIYMEGKLTHRSWEAQDGSKRYATEVVANYFRNLTRRENEGGGSGYFPSSENGAPQTSAPVSAPAPPANNDPAPSTPSAPSDGASSGDDDLPF